MACEQRVDDLVQSITLYSERNLILHGYIGPFLILYLLWVSIWVFTNDASNDYELGVISFLLIAVIQILTWLFSHWFVSVRCLLTCRKESSIAEATSVKVVPTPNNGYSELVELYFSGNVNESLEEYVSFEFQKTQYVYDHNKKCFTALTFPDDMPLGDYQQWTGFSNDEEWGLVEDKYGQNKLEMVVPKFMELFKERATAPFFVFQVFCVGLWCLEAIWFYSLFTLVMLITFEGTLVWQQLRNLSEIRKMGNKPYEIKVYQGDVWKPILSNHLVPGDIVSIVRSDDDYPVPCDLLILRGTCIVDESMLTGESVPQMKESIEGLNTEECLDLEKHGRLHVLYGGTRVLQNTPPSEMIPGIKASDNGCIAYVLRTGFNTSQGKLLRTILFGVKRVTENNKETFGFILFLLMFAIAAASYVWVKGVEDPDRNKYKLLLECTLILTSVVPPELPIELSLAVNSSLLALTKLYVFCTEPFRIPFAGKVEICCFDKTGTLTSDNFIVEGIAGLKGEKKITWVKKSPLETVEVLVTCHSLVKMSEGIVGDPLEKATLNAAGWQLADGDTVIPKNGGFPSLKIIQRFHFASTLKRMSVIASYSPDDSDTTFHISAVKGAPEVLKPMFDKIPESYDAVYLEMSRKGARVLALGRKYLGSVTPEQVKEMTREKVEENLEFVGFLVISCPLKCDSKDVIQEIQAASHKVVMVTGDSPLTACHVARELNFTKHGRTLILTEPTSSSSYWKWVSVEEDIKFSAIPNEGLKVFRNSFDLCLTGEGLNYLISQDYAFFKSLLPHICIFARVAPKQKERVVIELKSLGFTTLMCGDGTNDVGALRHADVGVAIISELPDSSPYKLKVLSEEEEAERNDMVRKRLNELNSEREHNREPTVENEVPEEPINVTLETQKRLQKLLKAMEDTETAIVVKLGDASIAAPFTSKTPNIGCVCHIIKQGRCTLVTTLQMFKILALNALILAYSQSVLYLDGIKFSDCQYTFQGLLLAGCFLCISRSKPLKTLSKERPLPNIFNLYTILTVLLQFVIHFACLIILVSGANSRSPVVSEKLAFFDREFAPSLLNSTVYIVSLTLQLSTFVINYKGHPFMESISENKPLMYCIMATIFEILALVSGIIPGFSEYMDIVEFPPEFQKVIYPVIFLDVFLCYIVDRTCLYLFGKHELRML